MNEALFFLHIFIIVAFSIGALRLGKEALVATIALYSVLANFFVLKQMFFFGWNITCSDVFAVGTILNLNLLQECWGKENAKKAVWISFFSMTAFGVLSQIHLLYQPSSFDSTQPHFQAVLECAPRLLVASLISFFVVQQIDVRFYGYLSKKLPWPWRNTLSLLVSQSLDTLLFSFLGLFGLVSSIWTIIALSFTIKVVIIASMSVITPIARRWIRHEV